MYLITFSRKMGASGSEIARRVANELRHSLYDTEAIENTAREMGFLKDVKEADQRVHRYFRGSFHTDWRFSWIALTWSSMSSRAGGTRYFLDERYQPTFFPHGRQNSLWFEYRPSRINRNALVGP
jgi:hypothetical protein